jgi:hypothetical protein
MSKAPQTRRRIRYVQIVPNEDGWSDWWAPKPEGYRLSCCGCGLVHLVDHRRRGTKIEWRFKTDYRATAGTRRAKRFSKVREALQS